MLHDFQGVMTDQEFRTMQFYTSTDQSILEQQRGWRLFGADFDP